MARLLFTVWPFATHLHPFMALALEARSRGHEVAFYTGGDALATVTREGFRCFPFVEVDWGRVARIVGGLIAGRAKPSQLARLWPKFLVETVPAQVRDLEALLAEWPADVLVCDIAMWAPILILRDRDGIPAIAFSHVANCILPGPEGPVLGMAFPHHRSFLTAAFAWLAARGADLVTAGTRRTANQLRRQSGLAPLRISVNQFTGDLPLYLVPSAPEFDNNRRDLPASVHYVGPCLWDKHAGEAPPAWLAETLAGINRQQPVIVVDEGSIFTYEPQLLELTARGMAGLPFTVILLAGEGRVLADLKLGPLASNVILQPHAPLSDVLPMADALVTNGNSESVLAALQAGLPTVVLPSVWDQAEIAWRVAESGVGLRISPRRATAEIMGRAVLRVLQEPSFRDKAVQMGVALTRCGGPVRAAGLIDELVNRRLRTNAL